VISSQLIFEKRCKIWEKTDTDMNSKTIVG
jgi:hypothetical protein